MSFTWWNRSRPGVEVLEGRCVLSTLVALSTDNRLLAFDSSTPGTIQATLPISGLPGGEQILGIDFRPLTGRLYALGSSSRLYTLNPSNGAATAVGSGPFAVPLRGTAFGFAFDPVADRIRIVSDAGQNMRLDPTTGDVIDADPNAPGIQTDADLNPPGQVVEVAYTNDTNGATTTTLYGIDSALNMFVQIGGPDGSPSPNLGGVTPLAPLGVDFSEQVGFDINPDGNSGLAALTIGGAPQLVRISLTSGPTPLGMIGDGSIGVRGLALFSPPALTLFAVTEANQLLRFNGATPGSIESTTPITGLQASEKIRGIDIRPSTGQIYALGSSNRLYLINPTSGAATPVGTGTFAVSLSGGSFGFDFDPATDRIRVVSDSNQNMRLDPDTGAVVDSVPSVPGTQPDLFLTSTYTVSLAYSNNEPGTTATTLYAIDGANDWLVRLGGPDGNPSPNLGVIIPVGSLGVDIEWTPLPVTSFDISEAGTPFAVLPVGGKTSLYTIDLATGRATLVGQIGTGTARIVGLAAAARDRFAIASAGTTTAEGAGSFQITVTRSAGTEGPATVDFSTVDGTAIADQDYATTRGTLVFQAGETSKTVAIPILNDSLSEGSESLALGLGNPAGGAVVASPGHALLTITDNDPPPSLSISNASVVEGNDGTTEAVFTVTLSTVSAQTVTVPITAVGGTATPGMDFLTGSGVLTFSPGETTKTVPVSVFGDPLPEGDETFTLILGTPTNATVARDTGLGVIINDDLQTPPRSPIPLSPSQVTPPADVTPLMGIRWGRTWFDPAIGRYRKRVNLMNLGPFPIRGPLALVLDGLPRGVGLRRPSGFNQVLPPLGGPYRILRLRGNVLSPGQVVRMELEVLNPLKRRIRFSPRVLAL